MARILLIDDEAAIASANQVALTAGGHEVTVTPNAGDGLAAAGRERPEVVVLEAYLDGRAVGLNLCRELSRRSGAKVIVLTRLDEHLTHEARVAQDRDGGWIAADLYLQKPLTPALLLDQVDHLLHEAHRS